MSTWINMMMSVFEKNYKIKVMRKMAYYRFQNLQLMAPIIYIIQPDDSLGGFELQYGVPASRSKIITIFMEMASAI